MTSTTAEQQQQPQRAIAQRWTIGGGGEIDLRSPVVMGILNVTPDSFSDGGLYCAPETAVEHAATMINAGAVIIDVGGESTRPGAERVDVEQQLQRIVPIIRQIRRRFPDVYISVDTTRAAVAEEAIAAGAQIINDVSAGEEDDERLFDVAAAGGCGLVLMHRLAPPERDAYSDQYGEHAAPRYTDVVESVRDYLLDRAERAIAAGVQRQAIVIDPGLGFGKTVEQNYELIAGSEEFVATGFPVLSAASRKSFIGRVSGVADPADRLAGSLAVTAAQFERGVRLFRVHDVAEHTQLLAVLHTIDQAGT